MDKKQMKQYAPAMIVIGVILLLVTGYQAFNPVMAVSAHDDRSDVQRMLATTTFEVTPAYTCGSLDMALLMSYDNSPQNGAIDAVELMVAVANWNEGGITEDELNQLEYAWKANCHVDLPPDPARIDDNTDTLTTSETTYNPGDTVSMTAWGENIGDQAWSGSVDFRVTAPFNSLVAQETDITVAAGSSYSATGSWTIPTDAPAGTYTLQTQWIDDAGTVHAMSTIDLGTETIWGFDINVLGSIGAILGVLLLIGGLMYRKK